MEQPDVENMLEKLEIRAQITKEHANKTQHILNTWARVSAGGKAADRDTFVKIYYLIDDVIEYVNEFKPHFPNYEQHVEQWTVLQRVALSRTNLSL